MALIGFAIVALQEFDVIPGEPRLSLLFAGMAALFYLTGLVWLVTLLSWHYRLCLNFKALQMPPQRFSGWGWSWSWFLPLGNLVLPFLSLRDVWRSGGAQGERVPTAFWVFWGSLAVGFILVNLADLLTTNLRIQVVLEQEADPGLLAVVVSITAIGFLLFAVGIVAGSRLAFQFAGRQDRLKATTAG